VGFFRDRLRIFLQGWKNIVPVVYEGTNVDAHELRGETGAQSSAIPIVDAVLGVLRMPAEVSSRGGPVGEYHDFRSYRPKPHRDLESYIERKSQVRAMVANTSGGPLRDAYNACLAKVSDARMSHFRSVGAYLGAGSAFRTAMGTGGTAYAGYLKAMIDATDSSGLK